MKPEISCELKKKNLFTVFYTGERILEVKVIDRDFCPPGSFPLIIVITTHQVITLAAEK